VLKAFLGPLNAIPNKPLVVHSFEFHCLLILEKRKKKKKKFPYEYGGRKG
jgi:hypothetical protein